MQSDSKIALEHMTPEDATAMLEDAAFLYAEQLAASSDLDFAAAMARGRSVLATVLPDGVATPGHAWCWLVSAGEERVGHVWLGPPEDGGAALFVWAIEIDGAARGRGYGTGAIEAIIAEADRRGLDEVRLNVFAANAEGRRLYERHGFEVTSEEGGYVAMQRRSRPC